MPSARRRVPATHEAATAAPSAEPAAPAPSDELADPAPAEEAAALAPEQSAVAARAAQDAAADDTGTGEPAGRRRGRRLVALLGALAVLAGSFGVWATVHGHGLRTAAAAANGAIVDRAATRSVTHAVTRAVDTIFSYNYAHTSTTRAAAQRLLTGQAIRQYDALFALVEQQAPKEKLVVTTKVTDIGVEVLAGGRARVLVFANQQDSRAGTGQTSYGGAMFAVTAVRSQGRWKIESIDTFTGPA